MPSTVASILAERQAKPGRPRTNARHSLGKLRKIERLIDRLVGAVCTDDEHVRDDDWERIFQTIFTVSTQGIGPRAERALKLSDNVFPDYDDPNGSYEADARVWIAAFKQAVALVQKEVDEAAASVERSDEANDHGKGKAMLKTVTISDGRKIVLDDLDAITPEQSLDLATAIADFLVRSGQIKDDVALNGAHLLQFMSEAGDMAAQKASGEGPVVLRGRMDLVSSKIGERYLEMVVREPYDHEVRLTVLAKDGQNDDDLTGLLDGFVNRAVEVLARIGDDGLECTTDDIVRV